MYWKGPPFLVFFVGILSLTSAQQTYQFFEGQNASITFHQKITGLFSACELYAVSKEDGKPFYSHGEIDLAILQPHQRGRFSVRVEQNGNNITATLFISQIQKMDSDIYRINFHEQIDSRLYDYMAEANVTVLPLPPGKAECVARNSSLSKWLWIKCRATVGHDGSGQLLCYQDSEEVPYLQPAEQSISHITTTFWMNKNLPINCCSSSKNHLTGPHDCNDFLYSAPNYLEATPSFKRSFTEIKNNSNLGENTLENTTIYINTVYVDNHRRDGILVSVFVFLGIPIICAVTMAVMIARILRKSRRRRARHSAMETKTYNVSPTGKGSYKGTNPQNVSYCSMEKS